ncbi:class I SAM-dependent methyltransferase [Oceanicola sp. 22II-s10i]|uniref:class I SAM-dependent methyltransferase n=1 Tax=Oceanicola sp. 22II-s10i TaxID=1317116 RepID=UPI0020CF7363|nr:class I SAM-dependent methyltransferase [Oceanicola sp. 22II-s10i]
MSDQPPGAHEGYAARVARQIPGLHDLHRMAGLLLAERVPADGRVLVLGAGGGLELLALARMQAGWRFVGVDPSDVMLRQARDLLGDLAGRVTFHEGYIDDAPEGPFDGAVCLLTLHFLPEAERLATLRALADRLRKNAPFVVMHHSVEDGAEGDAALVRYVAFGQAETDAAAAEASAKAFRERLPMLTPEGDEGLLRQAGFGGVRGFYTAFSLRGWVCCRQGGAE